MRNAVNATEHYVTREPRGCKEPDDLDELMATIDPAAGDDDAEDEEVDPEIAEFIGAPIVQPTGDEDEDDDEADDAAATAAATAAAATAAAAAGPSANDSINQLALLMAQREQREIAAAAAATAAAGAPPPEAPLFDAAQTTLTPEELAIYEQSRPTIEKIVRSELLRYHESTQPKLATTIAELRDNLNAFKPQLNQTHDAAFAAALRASVPDLDARVRSPEWQEYLTKPVPFQGGRTYGQALHEAVNVRHDVNLALEIVNGFAPKPVVAAADVPPVKQPKTPARAAGGGAPASVAASVRKGAAAAAAKAPYSKFLRATELVQAGKLAPDKYQKISDYYMDAHEAGLVDYSA